MVSEEKHHNRYQPGADDGANVVEYEGVRAETNINKKKQSIL